MTARKIYIGILVLILFIAVGVRFVMGNANRRSTSAVPPETNSAPEQPSSPHPSVSIPTTTTTTTTTIQPLSPSASPSGPTILPLADALARVTKKPFGIFITPANSPVQPEHFRGFHTGTDFETYPTEQNVDVSVSAICNGTLAMKKWATGYGGVAVESCTINGRPVTVVYGHVQLASVVPGVGDAMKAGEPFAILGKGFSTETDGERKHLHLGIHDGTAINILGYVQKKSDLNQWIDPMTVLQ
jgi:hypothetical protein